MPESSPQTPSAAKTRRTGEERTQIRASIPVALATRLEKEAADRMIGINLLIERGIEAVLDSLQPIDPALSPKVTE